MRRKPVCFTSLFFILVVGLCAAQNSEKSSRNQRAAGQEGPLAKGAKTAPQDPTAPDARTEDRAAIRSAMQSFAKAFEARDAKSLAAHWTDEGEYQNEKGVTVRGREALLQAFAAVFAKTPEVTVEVQPQSLRFLSRISAIEEGSVTVRRGPAEPATTARYNALMVKESNGWRLAQLSESAVAEEVSIADLGWLIGQWKSIPGEGAEIQTTYSWDPAQKFIKVHFTYQEADRSFTGSQVIGLDPATGVIHSWTFEASGGIGEADWSRDGDHWVLEATNTLADGRPLTQTSILRRVNDDMFTWQSINRMLDGAELADLAPVKITRMRAGNTK